MPLKKVIDQENNRKWVLTACYEELGHKGHEAIYHLIKTRYYWDGIFTDVREHVRTCSSYQFRDHVWESEPIQPNRIQRIWR